MKKPPSRIGRGHVDVIEIEGRPARPVLDDQVAVPLVLDLIGEVAVLHDGIARVLVEVDPVEAGSVPHERPRVAVEPMVGHTVEVVRLLGNVGTGGRVGAAAAACPYGQKGKQNN